MSDPKIRDIYLGVSKGWFVIDDQSKARIPADGGLSAFKTLKHAIIQHRKANSLDWSADEVEEMIHRQVCAREPHYVCAAQLIHQSRVSVPHGTKSFSWGTQMWKDLHQEAISGNLTADWLHQWEGRMPKGNCQCRNHWKMVKNRISFRPTFQWTWEAHNAVSKKVGKKIISLEQAKKIWGAASN